VPIPGGVLVKIERAKRHITELDERTSEIKRAFTRAVKHEVDPSTGEVVAYLDGLAPLDPGLSAIVGDAAHNLRASLEYLAYELVTHHGVAPPNKDTTFPPLLLRAKLQRGHALPDIKPGVSLAVRNALDGLQPYNRNPNPGWHELAMLHRLNIIDKHHQPVLSVYRSQLTTWWSADALFLNSGPFEDGAELGRWNTGPTMDAATFRAHFMVCVALADIGPAAILYDASEWLRDFPLRFIESEVLPTLEPFFP
jgi:hypothetical protein